MKLTVLGTGSSGNTYLLECDGEILILDCGINPMEVKKALRFDLSKIVGCFISHSHGDHARFRYDYSLLGFPIMASYDKCPNRENKTMGGFYIQSFRIPHGDTPNYGALIRHTNGETIIYMTDYSYTKYCFRGCKVNHFILEVNYQEKYVDFDAPNFQHKIADHCSLETCKKFLAENVTEYTKSVIAVHLGKGSTCADEIINEIKETVTQGVCVDVAQAGKVFEYGKNGN